MHNSVWERQQYASGEKIEQCSVLGQLILEIETFFFKLFSNFFFAADTGNSDTLCVEADACTL